MTIRKEFPLSRLAIGLALLLGLLEMFGDAAELAPPPGGYALRPDATRAGFSPASGLGVGPQAGSPPELNSRVNWNTESSSLGQFAASTTSDESLPPGTVLEGPPVGSYIDLDVQPYGRRVDAWFDDDAWDWQLLPSSIIYRSYLAGVKESRFSSQHVYNQHDGWLWEPTLGARVGIVRFGNHDPITPQGWQLDIEGSAQARLVIPDNVDVRSVDFRAGALLTRGVGPWRTKFGYYHLSSHLGDEFLLDNVGYPRLNYARDALVLGQSYYATPDVRLYAEVTWAFYTDIAEPWEFQFGLDYAPQLPTGIAGAPFFAINGYVRQEVNFSGNLVVQAGWAWRSVEAGRLMRLGMSYYNGKSSQFSFFSEHEQMIGFGVWYDF